MTNYATNMFTVTGPVTAREALARHMGCADACDTDGALRFDVTGWHDGTAYELGDALARRFPDVEMLCAYHPEVCSFLLAGVAAWAHGGRRYTVSFAPCHEADYRDPANPGQTHLLVLFQRCPHSLIAIGEIGMEAQFGRLQGIPALPSGWRIITTHPPHEITLICLPASGGTASVLALYPAYGSGRFYGAVDTYGGFGSSTPVSLDLVRFCVPDLPDWVPTRWQKAEQERAAEPQMPPRQQLGDDDDGLIPF